MENYQDFANKVREALCQDSKWKKLFEGYANGLLENEAIIREARSKFHKWEPLRVYVSLGNAKNGKPEFDLRYVGQSVATLTVNDGKIIVSTKKQEKSNDKYFKWNTSLNDCEWNSKEAENFRKYFQGIDESAKFLPKVKEHRIESLLLDELEKTSSLDKSLTYIQPISFDDESRGNMKTAISASDAKNLKAKISNEKGGCIDIFCRQKVGNKSHLVVIELKDENKSTENLEKTMYQAVAYAVFIRELVRSSTENGKNWMKIWGMNEVWEERNLIIKAVTAMPYKKGEGEPCFVGQKIQLDDDTIQMHYILLEEEGGEVKIKETSLKDK